MQVGLIVEGFFFLALGIFLILFGWRVWRGRSSWLDSVTDWHEANQDRWEVRIGDPAGFSRERFRRGLRAWGLALMPLGVLVITLGSAILTKGF